MANEYKNPFGNQTAASIVSKCDLNYLYELCGVQQHHFKTKLIVVFFFFKPLWGFSFAFLWIAFHIPMQWHIFGCDISIPPATASGYSPPPPQPSSSSSSSGLNTFGCIVVVAKEAVVDFPGVTLLLHWWIGWFGILKAIDLLPSCPVPSAGGLWDQQGGCHGSRSPVWSTQSRIKYLW